MLPGGTVHLPPLPATFPANPLLHDEAFLIPSSNARVPAKREFRRRAPTKPEDHVVFHGFEPNDFSSFYETYEPCIDEDVLSWFRSQKWCARTHFRTATSEDIPALCEVNRINPLYSKPEDFEAVLKAKNEFVIVAERTNRRKRHVIVGMIHYYLIWLCASPASSRRRGGLLKVEDLTHAPPQKVVYVCTLQTVKKATHAEYVKRWGVESEPCCGKCLFCLACEHGKKKDMRYTLLDSTEGAIGFYERVFGMQRNEKLEGHIYTPMQLDLRRWSYRLCFNSSLCATAVVG